MASNAKPGKVNLDELLQKDIPQGPIRRGTGFHLSTEEATSAAAMAPASPASGTNALSHLRTIAPTEPQQQQKPDGAPKRVNRGYKLREDLIKSCKRIALEEDRTLYDVMEEALELYVTLRHASNERSRQ